MGIALATAGAARAQAVPRGRVFVHVNGGSQVTTTEFQDGATFPLFLEQGDFDVRARVETASVFDVSGGVRIAGPFAVGVGLSRFTKTSTASVSARLPSPFFFNRPRPISGTASLERTETVVHVQALATFALTPRIDLAVFGGPSFFDVSQQLVSAVDHASVFPFDTAEFTGVGVAEVSRHDVGFHLGADLGVFFTTHLGVGGLVQFSHATLGLPSQGTGTIAVDLGGLQVGGGLRLRF